MIEEMEGVAGISRPRRRLFPGGGSSSPLPSFLPVEQRPPPSEGIKGGEVPPASPPTFFSAQPPRCRGSSCMKMPTAPWWQKAGPL